MVWKDRVVFGSQNTRTSKTDAVEYVLRARRGTLSRYIYLEVE